MNMLQKIISENSLTSVLDFGCGKGMPFTQLNKVIDVYNYDPVTSPINLPKNLCIHSHQKINLNSFKFIE